MQYQAWIAMATICTSLVLIFLPVDSGSTGDKILSLPGQPQVSFQQFSGYIQVNATQQRNLFYYFVEAETEPASKPLVLWLNGGPGCSSVGLGAFFQHGPFKPNGTTLIKNDYSWNKEANMLYVESPAGVGFSYSIDKSFYTNVNDEITSRDNHIFLQKWLLKFPQYKNSSVYLAGESYGGRDVPKLAKLVIQSKEASKLKGIILGNPLLHFDTDLNSQAEFYWSHGIISDDSYELFNFVCNNSRLLKEAFNGNLSESCSHVNTEVSKELSTSIDRHNVLSDMCIPTGHLGSRFQLQSYSQFVAHQQIQRLNENTDACALQNILAYLNRRDVQTALHAKLIGVTHWTICSEDLNYDLQNLEKPTIQLVGSLVKSGIPAMVYSGDQDSVIPFISTRTLIKELAKELGLKVTMPYRVWFEGKQVAGWTQVYGNILSFASIRGGGHYAPADQPGRALTLFKAFLERNPLP